MSLATITFPSLFKTITVAVPSILSCANFTPSAKLSFWSIKAATSSAEFISSPNIVGVLSLFEDNGTAYYVMEYLKGTSFKSYLQSKGGKISWEEAYRILSPVMDALSVVHAKGIIHRDVTPDNIAITEDGTVKLLDFGAARYSIGEQSKSLDVILKHGFAPYEQYMRHSRQGPFTDVYSLAASFPENGRHSVFALVGFCDCLLKCGPGIESFNGFRFYMDSE